MIGMATGMNMWEIFIYNDQQNFPKRCKNSSGAYQLTTSTKSDMLVLLTADSYVHVLYQCSTIRYSCEFNANCESFDLLIYIIMNGSDDIIKTVQSKWFRCFLTGHFIKGNTHWNVTSFIKVYYISAVFILLQ